MLELLLFVVTVILVVLFWPIFVFLGVVALGLALLAIIVVLALAFHKEVGEFVVAVTPIGVVIGLIWVVTKVLGEYDVAARVGRVRGSESARAAAGAPADEAQRPRRLTRHVRGSRQSPGGCSLDRTV